MTMNCFSSNKSTIPCIIVTISPFDIADCLQMFDPIYEALPRTDHMRIHGSTRTIRSDRSLDQLHQEGDATLRWNISY